MKEIPSGKPPKIEPFDGPANTWIPTPTGGPQGLIASGLLELKRCSNSGIGALMGKSWRNPVTGQVQMKQFSGDFEDFQVADLWTRKDICGPVSDLAMDPYLFRVIPMVMRTWMYHHEFREGMVVEGVDGADEDAMINRILGMHCIDAHVKAGSWAPIMMYVPMILFLTIAADIDAAMFAIFVLVMLFFLQWVMNAPGLYRFPRLAHLPLRLVLLIFIVMRMNAKAAGEYASATSGLAFIVAVLFCIAEIILGDGGAIWGIRLHCSYQVIRKLPNRIYICHRLGAAHSTELMGRYVPVNEKVTGIGSWPPDFVIIADVRGLIVQLRPMHTSDWNMLYAERQVNEEAIHRYIGLDIFSPGAATIDALNAALEEQRMIQEQNAKKKEWTLENC
jgi:hypothetical protein